MGDVTLLKVNRLLGVLLSSMLTDGGDVTLLKVNRLLGVLLSSMLTDGGGCYSPQG